jgi:hypothetical protein
LWYIYRGASLDLFSFVLVDSLEEAVIVIVEIKRKYNFHKYLRLGSSPNVVKKDVMVADEVFRGIKK